MDPLNINLTAAGISGNAITRISSLRKTIDGLGGSQEDVKDIRTQLQGIQAPLNAPQVVPIVNNKTLAAYQNIIGKTGISNSVNDCGRACEDFEGKLQSWKKTSTGWRGKKLSLSDEIGNGTWNKENVRTFKTRLETCQQTVFFAVTGSQLLLQDKQSRNANISNGALAKQMLNFEIQTKNRMELAKRQQEETRQRERKLAQSGRFKDGEIAKAIEEVKEQSRLLGEMQESLNVVFSQLRAGRTRQEIGKVVTEQESMALVGMPERLVGKMDQKIGDVLTTGKSASMVGVFDEGVDLKDFFKRR